MNFEDIFSALDNSVVGAFVRENGDLFAWIESVHVLAITIVAGTISIVDLRLLGYRAHRRSARLLILDLLPFTWIAFVFAVITGSLLFTSNAVNYVHNIPFLVKMVLIVLAGLNMAWFHLTAYRKIADWEDALPPPAVVRFSGAMSLGLWIAVIFFGRWIGFTI